MGILRFFTPDRIERDIYCYTPSFFKERGIDRVVFDIDNTIAAYNHALPSEKAKEYLLSLMAENIDIMFVSNNSAKRVHTFNKDLQVFAVARARKPSVKGILRCLSQSQNKGKAAFVGDQIFTDCFAARRAGISCFLVQPILPVENVFFKFKRFGEKMFIKRYKRIIRKGKL